MESLRLAGDGKLAAGIQPLMIEEAASPEAAAERKRFRPEEGGSLAAEVQHLRMEEAASAAAAETERSISRVKVDIFDEEDMEEAARFGAEEADRIRLEERVQRLEDLVRTAYSSGTEHPKYMGFVSRHLMRPIMHHVMFQIVNSSQ